MTIACRARDRNLYTCDIFIFVWHFQIECLQRSGIALTAMLLVTIDFPLTKYKLQIRTYRVSMCIHILINLPTAASVKTFLSITPINSNNLPESMSLRLYNKQKGSSLYMYE